MAYKFKEKIDGGFFYAHDKDCLFAVNADDKERARKSIAHAKREGADFDDFAGAMAYYMLREYEKHNWSPDKMRKQIETARKMWGSSH